MTPTLVICVPLLLTHLFLVNPATSLRPRRAAQRPDSMALLKKRLNAAAAKDKKEQQQREHEMQSDPTGHPQPYLQASAPAPDRPYGGVSTQQTHPRPSDRIRDLISARNREAGAYSPPETGCDFEGECAWTWGADDPAGFRLGGPGEGGAAGPQEDAEGRRDGHFLLLRVSTNTKDSLHVRSPLFGPSRDTCKVQVWIYQENMTGGEVNIVGNANRTEWVVDRVDGDDGRRWVRHEKAIGRVSQGFSLILDVLPARREGALVAIDDVKMVGCFPEREGANFCTPYQFRCSVTNMCINSTKVCDITQDCQYGDDETQNCEHMPPGARCNFEEDWCGWYNVDGNELQWARHNGSTPTNGTGPDVDHTYKNSTGKYLYVNMAKGNSFGSSVTLKSQVFNPPPRVHGNSTSPYYNSCTIRFYLHQTGAHKSGLMLQVTELRPKDNLTTNILWSYANHGNFWTRQVVILPNITHKYYLHFDARKGTRFMSDIAIDDVSLSPECFGLNIPESELDDYNYWNPVEEPSKELHRDFFNQSVYRITTCGAKGRFGPSQDDCDNEYNNTRVKVLKEAGLSGVQKWSVPSEGFYTFLLFGASGGKGSGGMGSSRGAMVRIVVELRKGQEFYILVGQEGSSACLKSLSYHSRNSSCIPSGDQSVQKGIRGVLNYQVGDGGGGGGGGTFLFYRNGSKFYPLAVAGGGGGLGLGQFVDTGLQHGHEVNASRPAVTGQMYGTKTSGAGGGWRMFQGEVTDEQRLMMGQPLLKGGIGGKACYNSTDGRGDGGFGGGGGGCTRGGGGGGYAGGSILAKSTNGEGGYSFIDTSRALPAFSKSFTGYNKAGPGYLLIVPAIPGCECDYRCLALDETRSQVACVCPANWKLNGDGKTCMLVELTETYPPWFVIGLIATVICLAMAFGVICVMLYNRYLKRAAGLQRQKMLSGPDLQLNRLRVASDSMMTEYNPSYEFGGVVYTLKDLKDIPRDQLRLVKALGQGAFGEVYQGFYRQRSGDTVEMPVAVKTLPEMSTNQAEMDFLMEALIMSKFHHTNIVHFIGVCFDKHPRFIVLELLAGGDLKNFLRESRPKPERASSVTMKDLVLIAVDVAKGCRYLEENRFIHRDIAARNCLLTTKGPGRVVKIADFGMSRDVYRSDYYRKGGKAMLPIKWMPPEAFLDGIFTSKTDVWSFGVLLWEIMSMGYMPYTGCANREVMQLVTSGGRLEPPANCPGPIYGIMTQCWHPAPEQRPSFATLLERLDYCVQDPNVMNAPLPVFNRPPSHERDATVMRPNNTGDNCLQVPQTTDYLIPNHTNYSVMPNTIGSTSSVDKLLPENSDSWETSFVMSHSRSTQPLLQDTEHHATEAVSPQLAVDPAPQNPPKISPVSLPNSTLNNHNNNVKHEGLRSGVSLDAAALAKQALPGLQKSSYANVGATAAENGVLPSNGPYTVQGQNAGKFLGNAEISC